ncbi:gene transfer agent family protein [uncultured Martelella sp.]|uniref:gene transfer agent family protein n=1 Tax=uncultured Martelella sp. TaxID=392331 RepID=UPI0029C783EB|nr:gene transfer agent family protein [uncultured Martelella sp.]
MTRSDAQGRANRYRGEVEAVIDGERRILCLTLGALAELETAFSADGLGDLGKRLGSGRLKAHDLIAIIGAGLRGGGNAIDDDEVAAMSMEGGVAAYAKLAGELLTVTFSGGEAVRPQTDGNTPDPS